MSLLWGTSKIYCTTPCSYTTDERWWWMRKMCVNTMETNPFQLLETIVSLQPKPQGSKIACFLSPLSNCKLWETRILLLNVQIMFVHHYKQPCLRFTSWFSDGAICRRENSEIPTSVVWKVKFDPVPKLNSGLNGQFAGCWHPHRGSWVLRWLQLYEAAAPLADCKVWQYIWSIGLG